jgi:hypothetical protein
VLHKRPESAPEGLELRVGVQDRSAAEGHWQALARVLARVCALRRVVARACHRHESAATGQVLRRSPVAPPQHALPGGSDILKSDACVAFEIH